MPHRTDDAYLLKFLRARSFNLESAYKLVSNQRAEKHFRKFSQKISFHEKVFAKIIIKSEKVYEFLGGGGGRTACICRPSPSLSKGLQKISFNIS